MEYRIRYRDSFERPENEELVQANSPAEAMVKFQCVRRSHGDDRRRPTITSVNESRSDSSW